MKFKGYERITLISLVSNVIKKKFPGLTNAVNSTQGQQTKQEKRL